MNEHIKAVNKLIAETRKGLQKIAQDSEAEPIMIEGTTSRDVYVTAKVAGNIVAQIMLDYDYPIYDVLGEDAPDDMWRRIADEFGLKHVCCVDILGVKK